MGGKIASVAGNVVEGRLELLENTVLNHHAEDRAKHEYDDVFHVVSPLELNVADGPAEGPPLLLCESEEEKCNQANDGKDCSSPKHPHKEGLIALEQQY